MNARHVRDQIAAEQPDENHRNYRLYREICAAVDRSNIPVYSLAWKCGEITLTVPAEQTAAEQRTGELDPPLQSDSDSPPKNPASGGGDAPPRSRG